MTHIHSFRTNHKNKTSKTKDTAKLNDETYSA